MTSASGRPRRRQQPRLGAAAAAGKSDGAKLAAKAASATLHSFRSGTVRAAALAPGRQRGA